MIQKRSRNSIKRRIIFFSYPTIIYRVAPLAAVSVYRLYTIVQTCRASTVCSSVRSCVAYRWLRSNTQNIIRTLGVKHLDLFWIIARIPECQKSKFFALRLSGSSDKNVVLLKFCYILMLNGNNWDLYGEILYCCSNQKKQKIAPLPCYLVKLP